MCTQHFFCGKLKQDRKHIFHVQVIRMYALGPNYFDSAFNKFDCIVIFGSIFEVFA